jgi:hypothetical protein
MWNLVLKITHLSPSGYFGIEGITQKAEFYIYGRDRRRRIKFAVTVVLGEGGERVCTGGSAGDHRPVWSWNYSPGRRRAGHRRVPKVRNGPPEHIVLPVAVRPRRGMNFSFLKLWSSFTECHSFWIRSRNRSENLRVSSRSDKRTAAPKPSDDTGCGARLDSCPSVMRGGEAPADGTAQR